MDRQLLGIGIYTVPDAAHLTGVTQTRIRRWLSGYRYRHDHRTFAQPAVWKTGLPRLRGKVALSFHDLMEVRFVYAFREFGISLQRIRRAIRLLAEITDAEFPFSQKKVVTDGAQLFAALADDNGRPLFLELSERRNYAFFDVVYPALKKGLVFNDRELITKWYPDVDQFNRILIDPQVCFGHPVIEGTRIRPAVLAEALKAERSIERVAEWYEIDPPVVRQAVEFHQRYLM